MKKLSALVILAVLMTFSMSFAQAPGVLGLSASVTDMDVTLNWLPTEGQGVGWIEDFTDGVADGWEFDPVATFSVANDMLVASGQADDAWADGYYGPEMYGDFILEGEVSRVDGNEGASMTFLVRGDGHVTSGTYTGYEFTVTANGYFSIWYLEGGTVYAITGWVFADTIINTGLGAWNVVTVAVIGNSYSMYINDIWVATLTDDGTLTEGYIGVGAYNSIDYTNEVNWNYVSVSTSAALLAEYGNHPANYTVGQPVDAQLALSNPYPASVEHNRISYDRIINKRGENVYERLGTPTRELDDFIEYNVYRDDVLLGSTTAETYNDVLPDYGMYVYYVTAVWDEGESDPSPTATVSVADPNADALIWDPDLTPGSAAEIMSILNDLGVSTAYTTTIDGYDLTNYPMVFAFLGMYPNDYAIWTGDPAEAALTAYLDAGGLLYIESGDLFGYQIPANLMPYFNLTANDGSNDLANVVGITGEFTEGWDMVYAGENSWVDELIPGAGAVEILENPVDAMGTSVLNDGGDYMTACFSFETGNLVDGDAGTREELVQGVLDFFGWGAQGPLTLDIWPIDPPIVIPANGGSFQFDATVTNNTPDVQHFQAWTTAQLPNGNELQNPIWQGGPFGIPGYGVVGPQQPMNVDVPGFAPPGTYLFIARVGVYPTYVADEDSFEFTKSITAGTGSYDNWNSSDASWTSDSYSADLDLLPGEFAISNVYPNPFNPTTTVSIALPNAADLTVSVFNMLGQQVAVLANGRYAEGYHNLTFNGSNLSSGIYFIQASIPGHAAQMQKVMLVK